MYDKAVEEIKGIFKRNGFIAKEFKYWNTTKLDKDLSDFLKHFEKGMVKWQNERI